MSDWQAAYTTIAEVAATLTGLLFVSVSVKRNLASDARDRWMLLVAKRSFLDFLAVLAIALLFLIPGVVLYVIGWAALWLGVMRSAWHINHWRAHRRGDAPDMNPGAYIAPIAATLVLILAGIAVLLAWPAALKLIYAAVIVLLFGACQNAWRLLTH